MIISLESDFKNICNNSFVLIAIFELLINSLCALKRGGVFAEDHTKGFVR